MASSEFLNKMKGLSKGFDWSMQNAGKGRGGLPVGSYQVKVAKATLQPIKAGKSAGQLGVMFGFTVVSGKKTGKTHTKFTNIEFKDKKTGNMIGLSILLGDLKTMGISLTKKDLGKLDKKIGEAVGRVVEIQVVEKEGFKNTYINSLVSVEDEIDDEEIEEEEDEDEEEVEEDEDEDEEEDEEEEPEPPKKKRGRPKGSKNKPKAQEEDEDMEDLFD